MHTFIDLYIFLKNSTFSNIIEWLNDKNDIWKGKDKQESLLRLFAKLNLISKLNLFKNSIGNFNKNSIEESLSYKDIFYHNNEVIYLNDKGDSSDLTMININNNKHYLITSSKNLNKQNIGKMGIEILCLHVNGYPENYIFTYCFCVRDIDNFLNMINKSEKTSNKLKDIIKLKDTILIDWNDLNEAYNKFIKCYSNIDLDNLIKFQKNKNLLILKPHQEFSVWWTINKFSLNIKEIIWGHVPRSGKSYIITGTIIDDCMYKDICNYLIITLCPNETISQYITSLTCQQLNDFNLILLNGKNKTQNLSKKNIFICSKQYIQLYKNKLNKVEWLSKIIFDIRFIDEVDRGGSTVISENTLKIYGNQCKTIFITGTYNKPRCIFNIHNNNILTWDIEDIKLCKEYNLDKLKERHGDKIIEIFLKYSKHNFIEEYNKYPELHILTDKFTDETTNNIISMTNDNLYGFSVKSSLLLKYDNNGDLYEEFQNDKKALDIAYKIFGKYNEYGIPCNDYPDNIVYMKRIEKICKINKSRYIDNIKEPLVIMCFLPMYLGSKINILSNTFKNLLIKYKIIPEYEIVIINSEIKNNPKIEILNGINCAKNNNKKGVLILSGKQCSVGVTIDNCDIVLLLNDNKSFDLLYQMMFRCMTESENKKCGFVIDMNMYRVSKFCNDLSNKLNPTINQKHMLKYYLTQRIINVNKDHYIGIYEKNLKNLYNNIYKIYSANIIEYVDILLLNITKININILSKEYQDILNKFNISSTHIFYENEIENEKKIKNGVEIEIHKKKIFLDKNNDLIDKNINYIDLLKHIIPLVCILTIKSDLIEFTEMYNYILTNETLCKIFETQLISWWGIYININILKKLLNIYIEYMSDNVEIYKIVKTLKELFINSKNNMKNLSKLIDKYLIPSNLEKKKSAEVSTPESLRNEMLDKIPNIFWTKVHKVFEPCCGKGGFLIDIVIRFMNGLKHIYSNETERYKIIVEKCLYFSDINKTNIFISKMLLDPMNKYKLNYNLGDTLKLNFNSKWNIVKFDAIIGNPPYEKENASGDNKLYLEFTKLSIDNLKENGYLLFVTPLTIIDYLLMIDKNRQIIDTFYQIEYISLGIRKNTFKNVNSTFVYFLLIKRLYNNMTIIDYLDNNVLKKTKILLNKGYKIPKKLNDIDLSIIKKITSNNNNYILNDFKFNNKTQRIRKNHIKQNIISEKLNNIFNVPIIDTINKSHPWPGKYFYFNKKDNAFNEDKLVLSKKGYLCPYIDRTKKYTYSDNFKYISSNNLDELKLLIESNIVKYMILQYSKNGFDHIKIFNYLKKINLNNIKNVNDIYLKYNLNLNEIKYINKI